MYFDTVEKEKEFYLKLCEYGWHNLETGETKKLCNCPVCGKSTVFAKHMESVNGTMWTERFCTNCGEVFNMNSIAADVFLNTKRIKADKIATPFGDIHMELNGRKVPLYYRETEYAFPKDEDDVKEAAGRAFKVSIIDIDFSDLKPDDIVYCGFDKELLDYLGSDEDYCLYSYETEDVLFGFCAGEPQVFQDKYYCYEVHDFNHKGFFYRVNKDPSQFDVHLGHHSKYVSVSVAWINKSEFSDPHWAIERILE